eukprot:NODE_1103_length_1157_cov_0.056711.p1 type:complete len:160 gc:universal NODE_1103_length_1157_cov_0.056711:895-416(-)
MPRFFAKWKIPDYEVFFETDLCYAMVNTKPVVPGHVLVVPQRTVKRYYDMTNEEVTDIMTVVKTVGRVVEKTFKATSLTITCQDGAEAGQTVPHVHFHILPRVINDFKKNDDIYDVLEGKPNSSNIDMDNIEPRTPEEMQKESEILRDAIANWEKIKNN